MTNIRKLLQEKSDQKESYGVDRLADVKSTSLSQSDVKEDSDACPELDTQNLLYKPIDNLIKQLEINIQKLNEYSNAMDAMGIQKELKDISSKVSTISSDSNRYIIEIISRFKQIKADKKKSHSNDSSTVMAQISNHMYQKNYKLADKTIVEFNQTLDTLKTKIDQRHERWLTYMGVKKSEIPKIIENGVTSEEIFTMYHNDTIEETLNDIQSRHSQIVKLEQSVRELYKLFQDTAFLVDCETDQIEKIKDHVTQTKIHAEAGEKNVKEAEKHLNNSICRIM